MQPWFQTRLGPVDLYSHEVAVMSGGRCGVGCSPVHRAAVLQRSCDKHRPLSGRLHLHRPQVEVGVVEAEL